MAVEGIILAAGLSSRAGAYKMTLEFNNKTILENVIDAMQEYISRIIVIGGYMYEKLEPVIEKYKNVELVVNENYMDGMFSSVKKGISCVKEERFFLTPGDYPLISAEVYKALLEEEGNAIVPTFMGKKGHPVLINSSIIRRALDEKTYSNLGEFVEYSCPVLVPVLCSGILLDIDTMKDYKNIINIRRNRG